MIVDSANTRQFTLAPDSDPLIFFYFSIDLMIQVSNLQ
jgi:hypothetical protein